MKNKIQAIVAEAKRVGIEKFVFATKASAVDATIRFEGLPMSDAVQLMIAGFHQAIKIELDRHPEYSEEYRAVWQAFADDLDGIVKASNDRTEKFKRKHKKLSVKK